MRQRIWPYLLLMRPANIITALADILAGVAIAGIIGEASLWAFPDIGDWGNIGWLLLSTVGLYGGGVVFNDVFDLELDKKERPERPLPSGAATFGGAIALGVVLLLIGGLSAFKVGPISGIIASAIVVGVLTYDSLSKHHIFWGPLNMGLCRSLNLLLGVSIVTDVLNTLWPVGLIPLGYIGAITLVSQGEVHGGNRPALNLAAALYLVVCLGILGFGIWAGKSPWIALPFLGLLVYLIFPPLLQAMKFLEAQQVMRAVKAGVLALIVLDSAIAAIFGGLGWGLCVMALLPISRGLAQVFSVT